MTKLTDQQRALLSAAAQSGAVNMPTERAAKAVATRLIKAGFLAPSAEDETCLNLTAEGRAAIGDTPEGARDALEGAGNGGFQVEPGPGPVAPAPKGKIGALLGLLRRPEGAMIEEMTKATGWQTHSVRGAMSGAIKKKLGLEVISEKSEAGRVYRIAGASQ